MKSIIKTAVVAIGVTLTATSALAGASEDVAECQQYADTIANAERANRQTSRTVSNGAAFLGAIIGGRNPGYAVESAIRSQGYGISTDMQMAEYKRQSAFNQCMTSKRINAIRGR